MSETLKRIDPADVFLWAVVGVVVWWSGFMVGYFHANMRQAERNLKTASANLEAARSETRKTTTEPTP